MNQGAGNNGRQVGEVEPKKWKVGKAQKSTNERAGKGGKKNEWKGGKVRERSRASNGGGGRS